MLEHFLEPYKTKKRLIESAKNVEINANIYNNQLKQCEKELNRKGLFGII